MEVKCIENKQNNGNFTVDKVYKITKSSIQCDFINLELPKDFILTDEFEFAFCKFIQIKY